MPVPVIAGTGILSFKFKLIPVCVKTIQWGAHTLRMETGEIARQANGAVLVDIDDTVVLATVVAAQDVKVGQDFFPLTVDYLEKSYAAGKIPGGFFRREGRPSEHETLVSRLIDRPLRPLFPEGFYNEVQVVVHVLSLNPEVPADIPAVIAASAALAVSGVPFYGPIGAARVGYQNGSYILNPTVTQQNDSEMDLFVAGTERAVLMVESEAQQLSEDIMLGAVVYGHEQMQAVINMIDELVREAGRPEWDWQPAAKNEALIAKITELAQPALVEAYQIRQKQERSQKLKEIKAAVQAQLTNVAAETDHTGVDAILFDLEAKIVRSQILAGEPRIDGRDTRTVRPIQIRTGVLPRTHGSALFTRGETQALVAATLGTARDEQVIDALSGEHRERFMLHYNMPPFATGEIGRVGSPKRREIGHGRLAKRALVPVLPASDTFAYTTRIVSEITESNGSSSMASVCGGCLAMLDAGVPLKAHVAGVAMGLILEDNRFAILTDILGDEDHLGDMDFKVQMDIKIKGLSREIMDKAMLQARDGRLHILGEMDKAISTSRKELSKYAPKIVTIKINPDKIRDIIGPGGKTIRSITESCGVKMEVQDDGTVNIASNDNQKVQNAIAIIESLTQEATVGKIYRGVVKRLVDFGAFVEILPGTDGLVHVSQISDTRVNNVRDVLSEGDEVWVKCLEIDRQGKIRLSMKEAAAEMKEQGLAS